ncbi:MAG TPA: hypothetical protein PK308_09930 [Phycisphaerales bacterium]|nr:hypothetical protein [Phycisphaerales bacterium]
MSGEMMRVKPPRVMPREWKLLAASAFVLPALLILASVTGWFAVIMPLFVLVIPIGALLGGRAVRRDVERLLRPHDGMVCPECHYKLERVREEGAGGEVGEVGEVDEDGGGTEGRGDEVWLCPECGERYARSYVVELWRDVHGFKTNAELKKEADARGAKSGDGWDGWWM